MAPVDEVMKLVALYSTHYEGWNVKHFHSWYRREHQGSRSYTWVKNGLQAAGAVAKVIQRGAHRKRRERAPMPGMMIHQDGSTHEWVAGNFWDLIVTMDDATGEHYSMFFVEQEGTVSSFRGVRETIEGHGLFASLYTDARQPLLAHPQQPAAKWTRRSLREYRACDGAVGDPDDRGVLA